MVESLKIVGLNSPPPFALNMCLAEVERQGIQRCVCSCYRTLKASVSYRTNRDNDNVFVRHKIRPVLRNRNFDYGFSTRSASRSFIPRSLETNGQLVDFWSLLGLPAAPWRAHMAPVRITCSNMRMPGSNMRMTCSNMRMTCSNMHVRT
jgi:hypothetical protein